MLEAAREQRQDGDKGRLMSDLIWLGGGGAWDCGLEVACRRTSTRMLYTNYTLCSTRALVYVYYNNYAQLILLLQLVNTFPRLTSTFVKACVPEAQCGSGVTSKVESSTVWEF